jgi:hypothetical protein
MNNLLNAVKSQGFLRNLINETGGRTSVVTVRIICCRTGNELNEGVHTSILKSQVYMPENVRLCIIITTSFDGGSRNSKQNKKLVKMTQKTLISQTGN